MISTICSLCKGNRICTLFREIAAHPEIQVSVSSCPYSKEGGGNAIPDRAYTMQDLASMAAKVDPKEIAERSKKLHEMQNASKQKAQTQMSKMDFLNPHQRKAGPDIQVHRDQFPSGFVPSVEDD